MRYGLILIKDRCLLPVTIETDSLVVVNVPKNLNKPLSFAICNLIEDCWVLFDLLENPTINHVYREANIVANFVAKATILSSNAMAILNNPIEGLPLLLMYDVMGYYMLKLVNLAQ